MLHIPKHRIFVKITSISTRKRCNFSTFRFKVKIGLLLTASSKRMEQIIFCLASVVFFSPYLYHRFYFPLFLPASLTSNTHHQSILSIFNTYPSHLSYSYFITLSSSIGIILMFL